MIDGFAPDIEPPCPSTYLNEDELLAIFKSANPPLSDADREWIALAMQWFDPDLHDWPLPEPVGVHRMERKPRNLTTRQLKACIAMRESARVFVLLRDPVVSLLKSNRWLEWLRVNSIHDSIILKPGIGPLGTARIEGYSDGTFDIVEEGGQPALMLPTWENGVMVDLIAWHRRNPKRIWSKFGTVDIVGVDAWSRHRWQIETRDDAEPIMLHRSPMSWLQRGGTGIAPVTTDKKRLRNILIEAHHLVCADAEFGLETKKLLLDEGVRLPLLSVQVPA